MRSKLLEWQQTRYDEVKSLPESHFPTEEVARLESENKLLKLQLKAVKVQRVFLFD